MSERPSASGENRALHGRSLVGGHASGPVVVLDEPLSFWGGFDAATGAVIDRRHPQSGTILTGTVTAMPSGRGSSSSSSVLVEAVRAGTAPAAIVLGHPDEIIALGALIADELYGSGPPVLTLDPQSYAELVTGRIAEVHPDGRVTVAPAHFA